MDYLDYINALPPWVAWPVLVIGAIALVMVLKKKGGF